LQTLTVGMPHAFSSARAGPVPAPTQEVAIMISRCSCLALALGLVLPASAYAGWNQKLGPGVKIAGMKKNQLTRALLAAATQYFRHHEPTEGIDRLPPGKYQAATLSQLGLGGLYYYPGRVRILRVPHTDTFYFQTQVREGGKTQILISEPIRGLSSWSDGLARAFRAMKEADPKFQGGGGGLWD
jgi:hypothetical protein